MASTFDCSWSNHKIACFHAYWALGLIRWLHLDHMSPVNFRTRVFKILIVLDLCLNLVLRIDRVDNKSERCLSSLLGKSQWIPGLLSIPTMSTSVPCHWTWVIVWLRLMGLEAKPWIGVIRCQSPFATFSVLSSWDLVRSKLFDLLFCLLRLRLEFTCRCWHLLLISFLCFLAIFLLILSGGVLLELFAYSMVRLGVDLRLSRHNLARVCVIALTHALSSAIVWANKLLALLTHIEN